MKTRFCLRPVVRLILLACCAATLVKAQGLPASLVVFPEDGGPVELSFEYFHGLITIPVSVEGSPPMRFILDTGAPVMVIPDAKLAEPLGLNVQQSIPVSGSGDGPPMMAPMAMGVKAAVGPVQVSNAVLVYDLDIPFLSGVDGIIGAALFAGAVVEIDWDSQAVRLHDPASFRPDGEGKAIPLKVMPNGHPYLQARVNVADGTWMPVNLALDSGDTGALQLSAEQLGDARLPDRMIPTIVAWGVSGPTRGRVGRVDGLDLGGHRLTEVVTDFAELRQGLPGYVQHGVLGSLALKRFRVWIDYPGERLILKPSDRFKEAFRYSTTGLGLEPWGPGASLLKVVQVTAGSPAAEAGIRPGDRVWELAGRPVSSYSAEAIRELLKSQPGTEISVRLRRGEEEIDVRLISRKAL